MTARNDIRDPDAIFPGNVLTNHDREEVEPFRSASIGDDLMRSVRSRCQAMSRHMPTNWGPQKLEVAIATQRPCAAACAAPWPSDL